MWVNKYDLAEVCGLKYSQSIFNCMRRKEGIKNKNKAQYIPIKIRGKDTEIYTYINYVDLNTAIQEYERTTAMKRYAHLKKYQLKHLTFLRMLKEELK